MKKLVTIFSILLAFLPGKAQLIISQFNWNNPSQSPGQSVIGPNAISISSSVEIASGGVHGTDGLNPGLPQQGINMVLSGNDFELSALDISIDFKKEQNTASFFMMGMFNFGFRNNSLFFTLPLDTINTTSYKIINESGIYELPSDNQFHTYRFIYNNATGSAMVFVDGNLVYSYQGTSFDNMYWNGAGNATIGYQMDGGGKNITVLDNLLIQNNSQNTILPLVLLSFNAQKSQKQAVLNWSTTQELNDKEFLVQRSADGVLYETIGIVEAQDGYSTTNNYQFTDPSPLNGKNFYRLSVVDHEDNQSASPVQFLSFTTDFASGFTCFPNPAINTININAGQGQNGNFNYAIYELDGKSVLRGTINLVEGSSSQINIANAPKGFFFIELFNEGGQSVGTLKFIKS